MDIQKFAATAGFADHPDSPPAYDVEGLAKTLYEKTHLAFRSGRPWEQIGDREYFRNMVRIVMEAHYS